MKLIRQLRIATALGMSLAAWTGLGQTLTNTAPKIVPERTGRVLQAPASETVTPSPLTARPDRPERPALSQDIKDRLQRFEQLREEYLREQRDLKRRLQGATDEDRERIRQLIQERREAWLEKLRTLREEARERLADLKAALPQHQEVLDAARESAQERVNEIRNRRGSE